MLGFVVHPGVIFSDPMGIPGKILFAFLDFIFLVCKAKKRRISNLFLSIISRLE